MSEIVDLHHIQLAVPAGQEDKAKAHPALLVRGLAELAARCEAAGFSVITDEPLEGFDRVYVQDPLGNRIELMERR